MKKRIIAYSTALVALYCTLNIPCAKASKKPLIEQAAYKALPEISWLEIAKTPYYLIFRDVVYDMRSFSYVPGERTHLRRFQQAKRSQCSQISESDYSRHPQALDIYLKKIKHVVGRVEETQTEPSDTDTQTGSSQESAGS